MSRILSNFFEVSFPTKLPPVYLVKRTNLDVFSKDDIYVYINKEFAVTFKKVEGASLIIDKNFVYVQWLLEKYFYWNILKDDFLIDVNKRDKKFTIPNLRIHQENEYSVLRRCTWRLKFVSGKFFLIIDHNLKVYNRLTINILIDKYGLNREYFNKNVNKCLAYIEVDNKRKWVEANLKEVIGDKVKIEIPHIFDGNIFVGIERVLPKLDKSNFEDYASSLNYINNIPKLLKQLSLKNGVEEMKIAKDINKSVFLIIIKNSKLPFEINICPDPTYVDNDWLDKVSLISEPKYLITRGVQTETNTSLLKGLSAFDIPSPVLEKNIVVFFTKNDKIYINDCLDKLNNGIQQRDFNFSLPSKFGIKLKISKSYEINSIDEYIDTIKIFLLSSDIELKDSLILLYLPEKSTYYFKIKALLAHHGRISQIISKKSFDIYSAWNLSANIYAKLGYIPWSIEDTQLRNSDLVLGLSFSSLKYDGAIRRNIGYVNIFDRRGVWKFMKSNTSYLEFDNRLNSIPYLVSEAIQDYLSTEEDLKTIDIHYTKMYSRSERSAIYNKIIDLLPGIESINFISIDTSNLYRVYDLSNVNFIFARGGIVFLDDNEFLLSTSQSNEKNRLLKIKVWNNNESKLTKDQLRDIAYRIIILTKLNWKSAVKETNEPVTIKYSSEIAKLTNYFNLTEWKEVNNQLSNLPWFI